MICLVTGHKGFIGSNLIEHLRRQGKVVIGLDAVYDDPIRQLLLMPWNDITEIYHQGAISDTTEKDVEKIYRNNVEFSIQLFNYAIHHKIPVKYASSASVYGNTEGQYNPLNYYALSKQTVDLWVQDNIDRFMNVVGFRYFNVYGQNENKTESTMSPITKFTRQAKTGTIQVFEGSEKMIRDFVCVDDVISIITRPYFNSGIYDVGTGEPISFMDVAEMIAEKHNAKIETIPFPDKLKDKYQFYTKARQDFPDHKFMSVRDWLSKYP